MASNPLSIPIPGDSSGEITCVAHAAYWQRATIVSFGGNVVFEGTGEGVPMKTPNGDTSFPLPPTRQGYSLSVTFEYSPTGQKGPFSLARVQDPIIVRQDGYQVVQATSEDSNDNDFNDTYLTVITRGV